MTIPDQLFQNYSDPRSQNLADRLSLLQTQHQWMDPQVSTTLASSDTSNNDLLNIADSLRQHVAHTWDGISHFFDDPVLQKEPTTSLALQRYLTGSVGILPVSDSSLSHIQSQLQGKGFGKDLPVNGVWDASWQAALSQHAQDTYENQLAGDKPGSVTSGGFLHSLLHSLTPSGVASAIGGFIQSLPADIGGLIGDAAGSVSGSLQAIVDPKTYEVWNSSSNEAARRHAADSFKRSVAVQNTIGANAYRKSVGLTPVTEQNYDPVMSGVNDLGTIFLLSGLGTAAKGVTAAGQKATTEGFTTRLATGEAARGPGVIAKTLLRPIGTRVATGAVTGGVAGGLTAAATGHEVGQGISTGIVLGGVTGGIMPRRAFQNLPVLKNSGPTLGRLLDADGLYYTARSRLATPYQYGAVRFAGTALAQSQAFSLKAHGVGHLEHLFGGDSQAIQQGIENTAPLNGINDALRNRLGFTAAGQHFSPDLDYLMFFLHGPMGVGSAGTASKVIGDAARSSTDGFNAALQHVGAIGQVEQGTGKSYDGLLKLAGGDPDRLHMWIGNKVRQHAAMQHAEEVLNGIRVSAPDRFNALHPDDRFNLLRSESNAVWNDPEAMTTAVARMLGSGENYLARNIQNEIARAATAPDAHLKHELSDYLDAGDVLTHQVLPHAEQYLLTPQTVAKHKGWSDWGTRAPQEGLTYLGAGGTGPGNLGLARLHLAKDGTEDITKSTLTSQQAQRDLKDFTAELAGADTLDKHLAFTNRALEYLFHNYGLDARKLSVFAGTPDKIVTLLTDRSKTLAAEVHLTADAPPALVRAFADIKAKGYRVVSGTDIGHAFRSDLPPLQDLGVPISRARKTVSALGLNPQHFSRLDYGADRRLRVTTALQSAVDAGKIQLPPYYTVQTVLNDLQDDEIVGKQLPWVANVLFAGARRAHKGAVEELIRAGQASGSHEAEALLKANIAAAAGLRQLSHGDVQRVLTRTDRVPWVSATTDERGLAEAVNQIPLMSTEHATEVFKAIQKGYSETPAYMLGLQKVEDMARYLPFRFRDAAAYGTTIKGVSLPAIPGVARITDNPATLTLMNLPNKIAQLRDTYRFNLSPYFSLRRIAKTNIKMGIDGVVPTVAPVRTMREQGVYDDAHNILDRVLGLENPKYKYLDEADRYLDSQDVFGLYNPRHFEAYYAHQKAQDGWSDTQIRDGIVRVFQYGSQGQEGRTALERSANVVFFPFSFEKTVIRNVGSYLLDKPAQALILSNALDAYRDFNNHHLNGDNPLAASWYKEHVPLLQEVLRLNAFAHGISPGELGGVNRPLLNAFMPQSWRTDKTTQKTLARYIPAMADLQRILKEGSAQSRIVRQSVVNGLSIIDDKATGRPDYALNARPSNKTDISQRAEATMWRNDLVGAFKNVLDYNDSVGSDAEKYHFGYGPGIPDELHGAVISKTNIGRIVHQQYPVYDPFAGAAFAIKRQAEAESWLAQRKGTPELARYTEFYAKAKTVIAHLNADEYPTAQAAQIQSVFHAAAIEYGSTDPAFYRWYNRTFATSLGPLEKV